MCSTERKQNCKCRHTAIIPARKTSSDSKKTKKKQSSKAGEIVSVDMQSMQLRSKNSSVSKFLNELEFDGKEVETPEPWAPQHDTKAGALSEFLY